MKKKKYDFKINVFFRFRPFRYALRLHSVEFRSCSALREHFSVIIALTLLKTWTIKALHA